MEKPRKNHTSELTAVLVSSEYLTLYSNLYGGETTVNELRVMSTVRLCHAMETSCTMSLVTKLTGIRSATVSKSVIRLVKKGWIGKTTNPLDRRQKIIYLSKKGKSINSTLKKQLPTLFRKIDQNTRNVHDSLLKK